MNVKNVSPFHNLVENLSQFQDPSHFKIDDYIIIYARKLKKKKN